MKKKLYLAMVPVGALASLAFANPVYCVSEMTPCFGDQTVNGHGCSTGCPPMSGGCCAYTEYRVDCEDGPDQFYRTRTCYEVRHCTWIVIPKQYECTVL
jgi:hypothetical protein